MLTTLAVLTTAIAVAAGLAAVASQLNRAEPARIRVEHKPQIRRRRHD